MQRLRAFASILALATPFTALAGALATSCTAPPPTAPRLDLAAPPSALRLPAIFGPHMVLQRSERTRIHGWAAPGGAISIQASWLATPVTCRADERGTWAAELDASEPGGPHRIAIQCGAQTLVLDDVLIGDVWLCSGQSNMEMSIRDQPPGGFGVANEAQELAAASRPQLRLFDVANAVSPREQPDCRGQWRVCDAQSVAAFSAVGYFFGAAVQESTQLPIGLIGSNWGGTRIEAWTSAAGLAHVEAERANLEFVRDERDDPQRNVARAAARRAAWWSELGELDPPAPRVARTISLDGWGTLEVPAMWNGEYDGYDGTLWLRREFELPAGLVGSDLVLELGPIDDMDTVWLDGERVGGMEEAGRWTEPRRYEIPARCATAGAHVLAIRVLDTGGGVGVAGAPEASRLRARDGIGGPKVALAGAWRARKGIALSQLAEFPDGDRFGEWHPTALYNAMIAPLTGSSLRGVLWYQGESNRSNAAHYAELMRGLVRDWRARFSNPRLAFYWVQIAPYRYDDLPNESARVREAQLDAADFPWTGVAITMDVGETTDIHPKQKRPVGERLARIALAQLYGKPSETSGPLFDRAEREGAALRVHLSHAHGLRIAAADGPFELAGADRVFHAASARVEGTTLVVTSPAVSAPLAVRYAWCDACPGTLFNAAGLPASPFRWPRWD